MAAVYPPPVPAKKRKWKLIGGIVAGTIVLMCACLAAAANSGNKIIASQTATAQTAAIASAPTSEPTVPPEPTSLPTATSAPEPTAAPEPVPTEEPTPVPTEAPTNTIIPPTIVAPAVTLSTVEPRVGLSREALTYFAEAAPIISDYGEALSDLGALSDRAGKEPALILSNDWKNNMTVALAELRDAANRIDTLDAGGSEAQPLDDLLQQIADETEPMTVDFTQGLNEMNIGKLLSGAARVKPIGGLIGDMQKELARLFP